MRRPSVAFLYVTHRITMTKPWRSQTDLLKHKCTNVATPWA